MKSLTTAKIKEILRTQEVSLYKGVYTVRVGYFYRHGYDENKLAERISAKLSAAGVEYKILECGDQFRVFRGGDTVKQGSHFWVKFSIESK